MNKKPRLFYAINLDSKTKQEIAEKIMPLIPKDKWKKTLPENLHITIRFLGQQPKEATRQLEQKTRELDIEEFDAELNCAGDFKGNVLWLGFGKGTQEFQLLNKKLQATLETKGEKFHAHITLARNKGATKQETQETIKKIRQALEPKTMRIKKLDLMESQLQKTSPKYRKIYTKELTQAAE